MNPRFGTMLFAEVLGTFFLVFMGCGSVKAYGGVSAKLASAVTKDTTVNASGATISLGTPSGGEVVFPAGQQAVMIAFAFGITVACIAQV